MKVPSPSDCGRVTSQPEVIPVQGSASERLEIYSVNDSSIQPYADGRSRTVLISRLRESLNSYTVWPKLKETLDGLGNAPLKTVIDTH
jgi:hypothetical protein